MLVFTHYTLQLMLVLYVIALSCKASSTSSEVSWYEDLGMAGGNCICQH